MGSDILDEQHWARTPAGKVVLRLIEEWDAGVTEHGDIVLGFTSTLGNDPAIAAGEVQPRPVHLHPRRRPRDRTRCSCAPLAYSESDGRPPTSPPSGTGSGRPRCAPWLMTGTRHGESAGCRPGRISIRTSPRPIWAACGASTVTTTSGEFIGRLAGSNIMQTFRRNFLGTPLRELHHAPCVRDGARLPVPRPVRAGLLPLQRQSLPDRATTSFAGERLILPIGADPQHPARRAGRVLVRHRRPCSARPSGVGLIRTTSRTGVHLIDRMIAWAPTSCDEQQWARDAGAETSSCG